jgi:hypothetical protein
MAVQVLPAVPAHSDDVATRESFKEAGDAVHPPDDFTPELRETPHDEAAIPCRSYTTVEFVDVEVNLFEPFFVLA